MHGVTHFPVGLEEGALSDLDVLILVGVAQVPGRLGGRQVRRVGLLEPVRVQLWLQRFKSLIAKTCQLYLWGTWDILGGMGTGRAMIRLSSLSISTRSCMVHFDSLHAHYNFTFPPKVV